MTVSLVLHLGVLAAVNRTVEGEPRRTKPTPIRIREIAPPPPPEAETPPLPPEPTPTPAPPKAPARAKARAKKPAATPAPAAAPSNTRPGPVDLGLIFGGNAEGGGPGVAMPEQSATQPARKPPAPPKRHRDPEPKRKTSCAEPPSKPVPIDKTTFEYPHAARAAGVEGRLIMRLHVATDGSVSKVEVIRGVDPRIEAPAIEAARKWRFEPARACGAPVAATFTLARRFELGA